TLARSTRRRRELSSRLGLSTILPASTRPRPASWIPSVDLNRNSPSSTSSPMPDDHQHRRREVMLLSRDSPARDSARAAVRAPPAQDSSVTGPGTVLSQGKLRRNGKPVKISNVAAVRADLY